MKKPKQTILFYKGKWTVNGKTEYIDSGKIDFFDNSIICSIKYPSGYLREIHWERKYDDIFSEVKHYAKHLLKHKYHLENEEYWREQTKGVVTSIKV